MICDPRDDPRGLSDATALYPIKENKAAATAPFDNTEQVISL